MRVSSVDYHTAGEPFRIVTGGVPRRSPARTVPTAARRAARRTGRPRPPAARATSRAGTPTCTAASSCRRTTAAPTSACCSGTRTATRPRAGTARSRSARGRSTPGGSRRRRRRHRRVDRRAVRAGRRPRRTRGRRGRDVTFRNVPSYVLARDVPLTTSRGPIVGRPVGCGGAIYASVPARGSGCRSSRESLSELIAVGREIKWALDGTESPSIRTTRRLSGVYGTILYDELPRRRGGPHQRNVTVFADGEVDRSPCGSGTSARVALLARRRKPCCGAGR